MCQSMPCARSRTCADCGHSRSSGREEDRCPGELCCDADPGPDRGGGESDPARVHLRTHREPAIRGADLRSKTACCWRGGTRSGASRCFCQCSRVDQLLENIVKTIHDTRVDALSDQEADQQLAQAIQLAFSLSQQIKTALDQARHCADARLQGKAQMVFETVQDYLSTLMKIHQAHRDVRLLAFEFATEEDKAQKESWPVGRLVKWSGRQ